jgi:hypothetical protein
MLLLSSRRHSNSLVLGKVLEENNNIDNNYDAYDGDDDEW